MKINSINSTKLTSFLKKLKNINKNKSKYKMQNKVKI